MVIVKTLHGGMNSSCNVNVNSKIITTMMWTH